LYQYPLGKSFVSPSMADRQPSVAEALAQGTIPVGTVAIKEGARVIASDGVHVGNVEQVLADERTGRATGFMLRQGLVGKDRRFIPITWADQIGENEVRLLVGSRMIESLGYVPGE
jgi:hypothetical protein